MLGPGTAGGTLGPWAAPSPHPALPRPRVGRGCPDRCPVLGVPRDRERDAPALRASEAPRTRARRVWAGAALPGRQHPRARLRTHGSSTCCALRRRLRLERRHRTASHAGLARGAASRPAGDPRDRRYDPHSRAAAPARRHAGTPGPADARHPDHGRPPPARRAGPRAPGREHPRRAVRAAPRPFPADLRRGDDRGRGHGDHGPAGRGSPGRGPDRLGPSGERAAGSRLGSRRAPRPARLHSDPAARSRRARAQRRQLSAARPSRGRRPPAAGRSGTGSVPDRGVRRDQRENDGGRRRRSVMKVLVTGGCGFIGSHVCEFYRGRGASVISYDNMTKVELQRTQYSVERARNHNWNYLKQLGVAMVKADVRDYEALRETAKGADYIVHTAAQPAVTISMEDVDLDFSTNVLGTLNVLKTAREYDIPVVSCATIHVYGN